MSLQKLYVPFDTRTNQYIMADIKVSDALLGHYGNTDDCYQQISALFFKLAGEQQLYNIHVIANDKLPIIRFHTEAYTLQTAEQILFFYNPAYHEAQNLYTEPGYKARKLRFLFLATGSDIRANAANFHNRVRTVIQSLCSQLPQKVAVKIRDHQHMTYDLFAAAKGDNKTYGYKLRNIYMRYKSRQCELPSNYTSTAYVKVTLPLSRQLKQAVLKQPYSEDYAPLYHYLEERFLAATSQKHLQHLAMVGNGLTPLVRNSKFGELGCTKETVMIGFDPTDNEAHFLPHWDGHKQVEAVDFILVATKDDYAEPGYCRYMNQVEAALREFAKSIELDPKTQELRVGFYQHLSYPL